MTSKQKHGSKGACLTCLPECLTVFKMSQVSLNLQVWANQGWRRVWIVQTEMCVCVPGGVYMLRWQESSRRFQPPPIWEKNTWCHQREADWSQMFQPGSFHVFNEGEGMEETFSSLVSPQILFPCLRVPSGASEGGKKKGGEKRSGTFSCRASSFHAEVHSYGFKGRGRRLIRVRMKNTMKQMFWPRTSGLFYWMVRLGLGRTSSLWAEHIPYIHIQQVYNS